MQYASQKLDIFADNIVKKIVTFGINGGT